MRNSAKKTAFTLIEVMVAVMIISVVIASLLQMRGNATHLFLNINEKSKINQFSSFFLSNANYGFENKKTSLDELLWEFDIEDSLRQELKSKNVNVIYQELSKIDMSNFTDDEQSSEAVSNMVFEIGNSILKIEKTSVALLRLRLE